MRKTLMEILCCAVAFYSINCFANVQLVTPEEWEVFLRLESFRFKPSLSSSEISVVTNSLLIPKNMVAEAAMCAIVVHDIPLAFPAEMRTTGYHLAEIIQNGRERKQSPVYFLKKDYYRNDITHAIKHGHSYKLDDFDYEVINQMLGRIAAVLIARELRQGKVVEFNEDDYSFSEHDKLLLKYAKYPDSEVPQMIISLLAKATIAGRPEYDLTQVLLSYEDINLDLMLSTLKNESLGKYAKHVLLHTLQYKIRDLGESDRKKIKTALTNYDYADEMDRFQMLKRWLQQEEPANGAEEAVLLEKLKGYVQNYHFEKSYDVGVIAAPEDTGEIVRRLAEIGSTNGVQFFLDNISWWHSMSAVLDTMEVKSSIWASFSLTLMGHALLTMKEVPLRQCMEALIKSKEGSEDALLLEYVTRKIHGKDFLREVERIAETSLDPKRWKDIKERLENQKLRLYPPTDSPFGKGYITQDSLGAKRKTLTPDEVRDFERHYAAWKQDTDRVVFSSKLEDRFTTNYWLLVEMGPKIFPLLSENV